MADTISTSSDLGLDRWVSKKLARTRRHTMPSHFVKDGGGGSLPITERAASIG